MKKIASILLVDDDETTNYINKLIIKRAELTDELLIALNGKDAIELLQSRCGESDATGVSSIPQIILLDINMPVMDGFEFLANWQALACSQKESVIIAVLTTSLDPRDIERVKKLGVTEFISKPLTKDNIEELYSKHFV